MICPNEKCGKQVDIGKAMSEIDAHHWNETSGPAIVMVSCDHCGKQVFMVEAVPMGDEDFEEIESDAMPGEKIRIPKPKEIKKVAGDYKGKHFVIMDEDQDNDYPAPYIDVEHVIEHELESHVADCRYYGIPAYIGKDQKLHARISEIEKKLDDEEKPH